MLASIACAAFLAPQGPGESDASSLFQLPTQTDAVAVAPFADGSGPLPARIRRAGVADFMGSGNADAWFLGHEAPFDGVLTVKMVRHSHVGRYREWLTAPGTWADAATFQHSSMNRGQVLLANPGEPDLKWGRVQMAPGVDPRRSQTWETGPSGFFPGLLGIAEIATRRVPGTSYHNRIAVRVPNQATLEDELLIVALDANGVPSLAAAGSSPVPIEDLRLCDYDGDGDCDIVARSPGLGILVFADDGNGLLDIAMLFPDVAGTLGAAFVGRLGENEQDTIGAVTAGGIVLATFQGSTWDLDILPNPTGVDSLTEAHLVRHPEGTDIYGIASSGAAMVLHRFLAASGDFQPAKVVRPGDPSAPNWTGTGAEGRRTFLADVDRDGDQDLLWQLPGQSQWMSLHNRRIDLRLRSVDIDYLGALPIGFKQFVFTLPMPEAWDPTTHGNTVEVHNFIHNDAFHRDEYWAELEPAIDPVSRTATFTVFYTEDPFLTLSLHSSPAQATAYQFGPGTLSLGGKVSFSVHLLDGTRRGQTWHIDHDPNYDGNKSPGGVKWVMRAAPPIPMADDELLPW